MKLRREWGPRGVVHVTIPHDKIRESGWQAGDDVTFNWDGKRMVLTRLPKEPATGEDLAANIAAGGMT